MSSHLTAVKPFDELSPQHQRFVEEYLVDLNGCQAAIRAGYSAKGARTQASYLLANPNIWSAVEAGMTARGQRTKITADRVLRELGKIAFSDIRNIATWTETGVAFVPSEEIDDMTAAAVQEVSEKSTYVAGKKKDEEGLVNVTMKVKMHDKVRALEMCARHLGMFKDDADDEETKRLRALQGFTDQQLLKLVRDKMPEIEKKD